MSDLIGAQNAIPNPSPDGGGLQQTTTGGFLNVHPHFTVHPIGPRRSGGYGDLKLWNAYIT